MNRFTYFRLVGAAALCLGAIGVGSAVHLPALASEEYRQYVAPMVTATCASSTPCLQETNTMSGPGFKGISASGSGSIGQTKLKSTSARRSAAGVLGQDISTSGSFDSGVLGTSTNGIGVQGTSVNGNGVVALSQFQSALFAENTNYGDGVQSVSVSNDGTNSSTQNKSLSFGVGRSGVWGHDDSNDGGTLNVGVAGSSTYGTGVSGSSTNYVGVSAVGGGSSTYDLPALSILGNSGGHSLIAACVSGGPNPCDSFHASFIVDGIGDVITHASVDADGNVDILGQYQINGNCVVGCSSLRNGAPGVGVTRYVPTASVPTVEDFGEAQLVDGQARVQLNADFANVIDQRAPYFVFITPEGDTNGVYVGQKTKSGFTVRENRGGRSAIAFQYRIVAKPYGVSGSRLPMIERHRTPLTRRRSGG